MTFTRYVGDQGFDSVSYRTALATEGSVVVDRLSPQANATVDFEVDGHPLGLRPGSLALDFLDLAVLVYLADEMVERSSTSDYWTRSIDCIVPVADPNAWSSCSQHLIRSLALLSGDRWSFEWPHRTVNVPFRAHRKRLPSGFDAVCMFSGGTDSLLGAIRLLDEGKNLILVGHQAEGQSAKAQTELTAQLRQIYPGRFRFVQCRVSRSRRTTTRFALADKKENSHRPRSFLFLALAIAIAREFNITDVFMPENGFMTLNIPLQKSRTGSLSTRTTHPAFLMEFLAMTRALGLNVTVRNPFLLFSKTDMLRGLPVALGPAIRRSVSCSRAGRYNDLHVRHCGYCVPCVLRRVALMEPGLDSPDDYAFDVFTRLTHLDAAKRHDTQALVQFATRVANARPANLEVLLLSHGYFPPTVGAEIGISPTSDYAPWTGMLQRWATDLLAKVGRMPIETRRMLGVASGRRS